MHLNLISAAVPVFFAAILVESFASWPRSKGGVTGLVRQSPIPTGLVSQLVDPFLRGVGVFFYAAVYRHRVIPFSMKEASPRGSSAWSESIPRLLVAPSEPSNQPLWAVHAVHHQSQDFNLAVALRQPALEALTIIPFHLPLALVGVDPGIYASCYAIDLIYQFIHTEWVPRTGFLGVGAQHSLVSPRSSRHQPALPGSQFRWYSGGLGQGLRHFRARDRAGSIRRYPPARELQPRVGNWAPARSRGPRRGHLGRPWQAARAHRSPRLAPYRERPRRAARSPRRKVRPDARRGSSLGTSPCISSFFSRAVRSSCRSPTAA